VSPTSDEDCGASDNKAKELVMADEIEDRIQEISRRIKKSERKEKDQVDRWHGKNWQRQQTWEERGARDDDRDRC